MRWSVFSCFAWYIVLCRSVFLSVISVIRSGAGFVVSRVGRVSGICVLGRLVWFVVLVDAVIRLE